MKKLALFVACMMIAGSASAQIAIAWDSQPYFVLPGGNAANFPADYVPVGALHTLVWSSTPFPTEDWVEPGSDGIGADEWALWSGGIPVGGEGGVFDYKTSALIFTDADVGGADINSGYVYSRIFEGPTAEPLSWYYQSLVWLGPGITVYDSMDPNTILDHRTAAGAAAPELGDVDDPTYGAGMYQVIPEPSVYAMLILGLGFMGFRRFFRREQ